MDKKLEHLNYSIFDLVDNFPGGAHIKESKNFTYLYSNMRNLEPYGLSTHLDLIGKSIFDINSIIKRKLSDEFMHDIHCLDRLVVETGSPVNKKNKMFVNVKGFVVIYQVIKIPLYNDSGLVSGILTISFDSTKLESLNSLRQLYKKFYKGVAESNKKFLEYINLKEWKILTDRELDCIFALLKYRMHKLAAESLSITINTFDTYLNRIKFKTGITTTNEVITKLLNRSILFNSAH